MLKLLARRERGADVGGSSAGVTRTESSRRMTSLHLSKYQDFEPVHSAGVNSLDLDSVECR